MSANIQAVSALTVKPIGDLEGGSVLLTTAQIITSTSALDSTFAPLVTPGVHIFNGIQYEPNASFMPLSHDTKSTALFSNYDGGLFQDTDAMSVVTKEVLASFTVSKDSKTPVAANKVFTNSQQGKDMMPLRITYGENTPTPKSQPNEIQRSREQNQLYVANSQDIKRGTLVSTNYNTVSMLRTMEDLQNIGYLGMNDVNAKPIPDALTRELKVTTHIALVQDKSCANRVDLKQLPTCQDKNVGKTAAMPVVQDQNWSAQMTKNFSFEVKNKLDAKEFHILEADMKNNIISYSEDFKAKNVEKNRTQLLQVWQMSVNSSATNASK
ncbi:hypothetical protein IQ259_04900 [Fortiea sp. LEGE XX443]|nr:hypothetical protein [Fortiea sp. LEGE XX443]